MSYELSDIQKKQKAIFIDKDGTLIVNKPYNVSPDAIELVDGVGKGLKILQDAGYKIIVISNQSGIARGYFKEEDLEPMYEELSKRLKEYGVILDGFFYCPHHPEGTVKKYTTDCFCRKPKSGMLKKAALIHKVDIKNSWMIGDILHDIEAGNRAGAKTILFDSGYETEWKLGEHRYPDFIVHEFSDVVDIVLNHNKKGENNHYYSYI